MQNDCRACQGRARIAETESTSTTDRPPKYVQRPLHDDLLYDYFFSWVGVAHFAQQNDLAGQLALILVDVFFFLNIELDNAAGQNGSTSLVFPSGRITNASVAESRTFPAAFFVA
jgi:hypothetical protein